MSRFTIQCESCESRLAVRHRSEVDRKFACPKCGAMVLVVGAMQDAERKRAEERPSTRWRETSPAEPTNACLLESSYDVVNEILDQPPISAAETQSINGAMQSTTPHLPKPPVDAGEDGADAGEHSGGPTTSRVQPRTSVNGKQHLKLAVAVAAGAFLAFTIFRQFGDTASATIESASVTGVVALKPVLPDAALSADEIDARLRAPFAGFSDSATLPSFLQRISWSANIPVSLDVDSIKYSRVGLDTRVASAASGTLREVLQLSLGPLQLIAETRDGMIVVSSTVGNQRRQAKHDVSDLLNDEMGSQDLGALIRDFVQPTTWRQHGGVGFVQVAADFMTIDNSRRVHLDTLDFCDVIRQARGLPSRGKAAAETVSTGARQLLETKVSVDCGQPTRLSLALAQIEKRAGCHLLVDWRALQDAGRSCEDHVVIHSEQATLREVLTQITAPLALTFRVVSLSAIEITTPQAELASELVVFHVVTGGQPTVDSISAEIQTWLDDRGPGRFLAYEPVSQTLIARLPWSQQMRLAESLTSPAPN